MKTHYKNIFIRIGTAATIVALSGAFNVLPLSAQFNPEINYQGKLTNAQNVAVSDGVYHMKFRLYTTASGGTNIWEDDRSFVAGNRITVTSGLFSVLLGSSTPLTSVDFNQTLYLEVLVGGTASSTMETLSPRKKLGAVPAAFEAGKLDGIDSTSFVRSDEADTIAATSASTLLTINQSGAGDILNLLDGGNEVFTVVDGGNVGIGTTTPWAKLSIAGSSAAPTTPLFSVSSSTPTGTTTVFHITSQGNVGIGTTTPQAKLDIVSSNQTEFRIQDTSSTGWAQYFAYNDIGNGVNFGIGGSAAASVPNTAFFYAVNNTDFAIGTDNTTRLTIKDAGNVGIGTTSPYAKLSISSTAGGTTPLFTVASSTNGTGTTTLFHITAQGNIGIGTSTPLSIFNINQSNQSTTSRSGIFITGAEYYQPSVGNDANAGVGLVLGVNRSGNRQLWIGDTTAIGSSTMGVFRYNTGDLLPDIDAVTGDGITRLNVNIGSRTKNVGIGMGDDLEGTFPTSKLSIAGNLSVGDNYLSIAAPAHGAIIQGNTGVGTSSPWAKLSVAGSSTDSTTPLFSVSSSTPTSTTTVFHITSQGYVGIGTTTPGTLLSLGNTGNDTINISGTATSTFGSGINVRTGCFAVNGVCVGGAGGGGSGTVGSGTTGQLPYYAGSGTTLTATSSLFLATSGAVGIGTTTPLSKLAVSGGASVGADYNIAAPTNGMIIQGNVGIGVTDPSIAKLVIDSGGGTNTSLKIEHTGSNFIVRPVSSGGSSTIIENTGGGALVINPSGGNVGIGTTSPYTKLAVVNSNNELIFNDSALNSSANYLTLKASSGTNGQSGLNLRIDTTNLWQLVTDNNLTGAAQNAFFIQNGGNSGSRYFTVTTSGNVGIGTTSPFAKLAVHAKNGETNTRLFEIASSTASATTTHFVVLNSGNIGIGTTSPYAKLSVVGEAVARNFTATSTTATSTFAGGLNVNSGALQYDYGANKTSIENLNLGPVNFEADAGVVSWIDVSVTASSSAGTDISYSAQLDSNKLLTIYGESNGAGGTRNTGVNVGTSTTLYSTNIPWNSLVVGDGIICLDNGGDNCDDSARTRGTIYANNATVSGLDLAEEYPTKDSTLDAGDIVMLDVNNPVFVRKYNKVAVTLLSQKKNKKGESVATTMDVTEQIVTNSTTTGALPLAFGVVSTDPGLLLGGFDSNKFKNERRVPLALAGRVPVKMTLEGGPVAIGDRIGVSSIPGVGMKLKKGQAIGIALEPFDVSSPKDDVGVGSILVFVDVGASRLGSGIAMGDMTLPLGEKGIFDLGGRDIANARSIISESGTWSISADGTLIAENLTVKGTAKIGSPERRTGITLYDEETGAPYCLTISGGLAKTTPAECADGGAGGSAQSATVIDATIPEPPVVSDEPATTKPETTTPDPEPVSEPELTPEPPVEETVATSATTSPEQL